MDERSSMEGFSAHSLFAACSVSRIFSAVIVIFNFYIWRFIVHYALGWPEQWSEN